MRKLVFFLMIFAISCLAWDEGISFAGNRLIMKPAKRERAVPVKSGPVRGQDRRKIISGRVHEWRLEGISPVDEKCVLAASRRFNVPASIILTVMDVEGGEIGGREKNRNGTWDMGPMQVNTCHLPELAPFGLTAAEIMANGCLNVHVGTYLLKRHLEETGGKVLESVGRYHSRNEPHKSRYQRKAISSYRTIKANPDAHVDRILKKANAPLKGQGRRM